MEVSTAVVERLATTSCIPIASLKSTQAPAPNSSIKAVVSLIWPYSTSTRSAAILLAEPDFRKRNSRGQVRIQLHGAAAQALIKSRIQIADIIHLSLQGARWVEGVATVQTPGKSVEGELLFKHRLQLLVQRYNVTVSTLEVDETHSPAEENDTSLLRPTSPQIHATPVEQHVHTPPKSDHSKLWNTPTPFRNSFGSADPSSDDIYDLFGDTGALEDRPAKRFKFGRTSGKWKYVQRRSDSPEDNAAVTSTVASSPLVMGPPKLPPLQTAFNEPAETSTQFQPSATSAPRSPELRPVQSAILPAISPFPLSPRPPYFGSSVRQHGLPGQNLSHEYQADFDQNLISSPRFNPVMDTSVANTVAEPSSPAIVILDSEDEPNVQATRNESQYDLTSPNFQPSSPPLPRSPPPGPSPSLVPSQRKPVPVIDLLSDEEEVPVPSSADTFSKTFQVTESQGRNDQVDESDEHYSSAIISFDGAADRVEAASAGVIINDSQEQDLSRISTFDNSSLISSSNLGRATTQESGQLTPELSQDTTHVAPLISLGHRVDDILDGRLPPTPQRSDIPAEMVGAQQIQDLGLDQTKTRDQEEMDPESHRSIVHGIITASEQRQQESQVEPPDQVMESVVQPSRDLLAASADTYDQSTGRRTNLTYLSALSSLKNYLNNPSESRDNLIDVLAIVTSPTAEPQKAKGGPRDYFTMLHVGDRSIFPKTIQVQLLRRSAHFLPVARVGDIALLRNFAVRSFQGEPYLLSESSSAWCVWRYATQAEQLESDIPLWARQAQKNPNGIDEECRGPSVEVGPEERGSAHDLNLWWQSLPKKAPNDSHELSTNRTNDTFDKTGKEQSDRDVLVAS